MHMLNIMQDKYLINIQINFQLTKRNEGYKFLIFEYIFKYSSIGRKE